MRNMQYLCSRHRIGVMKAGAMVKVFERHEFSKERILRAMMAEND